MQRYSNSLISIAICLAALAGFVDALTFARLGLFASFMSGNSTRLGVGLGTGDWDVARMATALLLSFVSGVVVAAIVARRWPERRKPAVMLTVTLLLLGAAIVQSWLDLAPLLLLAAAMGAANGVYVPEGEAAFGVTYMTGTLVRSAQRLTGALMGDRDRWSWLPYFCLWCGFVAGVLLGARAYAAQGLDALWIAAGAAAAITVALAWLTRSERSRPLP